jgi:hypothetical protein
LKLGVEINNVISMTCIHSLTIRGVTDYEQKKKEQSGIDSTNTCNYLLFVCHDTAAVCAGQEIR